MTTRSTFTAALAALAIHTAAFAQTTPPSGPPPEPTATEPAATEPPPSDTPPPQPAAKKKGLPVSASYDGGYTVKSDDGSFELKLNGLFQSRWELISTPAATEGGDRTNDSRFLITRARMALNGYVFKDTQFKIEFAFSDAGNTRLRDFFVNQVLAGGMVQVRVGQMKKPFNRNEIISDFGTEFVEKAITNQFGSRDIGVAIHNGYEKSPEGLEWVVGIWNGNGDATRYPVNCSGMPLTCTSGTPTNTPAGNFRPEAQVRVGYNLGNVKGYSEGDFDGGPLRLGVAANARLRNLQNLDSRPFAWDLGVDAVVKIMGLDVWAAVFFTKNKENASETALEALDEDPQLAFHVQAGYMVLPKTLQVAARFARFPLATPPDGTDVEYNQEIRGAVSWYFSKSHNYKWTTDFGMEQPTTEGADPVFSLRTGLQLIL